MLGNMWRGRCRNCFRLPVPWLKQDHAVRFYSVFRGPAASEDVQVTCGSSGFVTVNIYNNHPGNGAATTRPLIIYIPSLLSSGVPSGTSFPVPTALLSQNTVVQINPRWSSTHLFPTPLHDTLRAYNWIIENLVKQEEHAPSSSSSSSSSIRHTQRPIAIYGTNLGGTLATSLALTESLKPALHKPYITALAVQNAIFDWSTIATTSPPVLPSRDTELSNLYSLRAKLFRNPASAFDAFASPLLFFRTTGLATPAAFPATLAEEEAGRVENVNVLGGQYVGRKSHLRFPPKGSELRIPVTRIAVLGGRNGGGGDATEEREVEQVVVEDGKIRGKGKGKGKVRLKGSRKNDAADEEGGVLREQAEEMLKLMRRSVALHEGKERYDDAFDGITEAERRVALVELGRPPEGRADDGEWAAEFFEEALSKGGVR